MRSTIALLCIALAACSDATSDVDLSVNPPEITDPPADTAEPDTTLRDTAVTPDAPTPLCANDRDCNTECVLGRCASGRCIFEGADPLAQGCVMDPDALTCLAPGAPDPARPTCFFCNPSADIGAFVSRAFAEDFESGVGRLTVDKLTPSPASWTLSARRVASGEKSLYFGDPSTSTYDVGEHAAALAMTPPLVLPPDGLTLRLDFQLWADTEETPGFDRLRVLVIEPSTSAEADPPIREVWTSDLIGGTTRGAFLPISVDLGLVPDGARIGFEADTLDEVINAYEGFYLDAIAIGTSCCDADRPCDDGDACTTDACVDGECRFERRADCCLRDVDCDDGDPCTTERCDGDNNGGVCVAESIVGCCADITACDDSNPCTEDRCPIAEGDTTGLCLHAPLCCAKDTDCDDGDPCTAGTCLSGQCQYREACCRADSDCDDAIACTTDHCDAGLCKNDFNYSPGCCIPELLTERFDSGPPPGFSLSPPTNNIGWRILASNQARSGTSVLYYGHPTLGFYESGGRNTGTATTRELRLPDGVELTLSFSILIDVEASPTRDLFRLEALLGAGGSTVVTLLDKNALTRNAWQDISLDLSPFEGQTLSLRFVFDTVDATANTTRGIFIDDLRVLSSCLPDRCVADSECTSPTTCILGTCDNGACAHTWTCP
jgi:hypothetical protein